MENLQMHNTSAKELYNLGTEKAEDEVKYLMGLLSIFMQETPKELKEMKDALQARNIDAVCQTARKTKSSAGIIQAEKLSAMLEDIEVMGKNGATFNQLLCLIDNAAEEFNCMEKAFMVNMPAYK